MSDDQRLKLTLGLGLSATASDEAIKQALRDLANKESNKIAMAMSRGLTDTEIELAEEKCAELHTIARELGIIK